MLINKFIKQIESKRQIKIPICFLNTKGLNALNEALESGVPYKVANFYKNFKDYYDLKPLKIISQEIENRKKLSQADTNIINKLSSIKHKDSGLLFEISGNLFYIATLLDDLRRLEQRLKNKNLRMKKSIRISILLWIYLNIVELVNKHLAEFIYNYIKEKNLESDNRLKNFIKKIKSNKHPELGTTIDALIHTGLLDKKENSVFNNNHFIRNRLSHANMYYDIKQRTIYQSNGDEYPIKQFMKDLNGLFAFLNELIFQMNNNDANIDLSINSMLKEISTVFLKIERSGVLKKAYSQVIFQWKKEANNT
ncbi:MAG TPA: hypothetical protein PLX15_05425 [Candidatus Woesearchaeota archaeon]|nr:hypothetical protein [Candidatus Woesearchaeota archaeon]